MKKKPYLKPKQNTYAHRSNNLSDLGSATTARANLGAAEDSSDPNFSNDPNAAARRGLVQQKLINLILDTFPGLVATELHATGSAPMYACRAWVNFNGTGATLIRGSGNVSSITDNGTGSYTVNFTTAMPDTNYATIASAQRSGTAFADVFVSIENSFPIYTTTAVKLKSSGSEGSARDCGRVSVAIFR